MTAVQLDYSSTTKPGKHIEGVHAHTQEEDMLFKVD